MKVLIAVDQSDLAIMSFRSFMEQFAKDDMQLHMLYIESIPCCRTSMMEMRRNSSGIGAIAVAGLMKENDLESEADALIHYIRNEFAGSKNMFKVQIRVQN